MFINNSTFIINNDELKLELMREFAAKLKFNLSNGYVRGLQTQNASN